MPIFQVANAELGLNSLLFVGKVTRRQALAFHGQIDPDRADTGPRWINILDPAADLSEMDPGCLLEIKEQLKPLILAMSRKGEFRSVLVSNSRYNDPLMACWRAMTTTDFDYPSDPDTAATVQAACVAHGLSNDQSLAAQAWLQEELRAAKALAD